MRFMDTFDLIQFTDEPDGFGGRKYVPNVLKTVRGVIQPYRDNMKQLDSTVTHTEERHIFQHKDLSMAHVKIDAIRPHSDGRTYIVYRKNFAKRTVSYVGEIRMPRDKFNG